jgi:adenylylsulfate kinase
VKRNNQGFAVWITGLPASGKSTIANELANQMREMGAEPAVLESDTLRQQFSSNPSYDEKDREFFYGALAFIGRVLTDRGIPAIIDATANRRSYRNRARQQIERFVEVFVDCPLEVCIRRDPKGIYRKVREGQADHVPGMQTPHEAPERPDIVVRGDRDDPKEAARRIIDLLVTRGFLQQPNVVPVVSFGTGTGMSVAAVILWQLNQGRSGTGGAVVMGILLLLLACGICFWLAASSIYSASAKHHITLPPSVEEEPRKRGRGGFEHVNRIRRLFMRPIF